MGIQKHIGTSEEDTIPVSSKQIQEAVRCIFAIKEKQEKSAEFLGSNSHLSLTISTHRVPSKKQMKYMIKLPNPLYTSASEVCVFTKDSSKEDVETTKDFYENLFDSQCGFKPKIVPLLSINKDYKSYESRRQLCCSYDLFLGDARIYRFLPERLGKIFHRKNNFPWELNLKKDNFKAYLENIMSCTQWIVSGKGSCSTVHVANSNFNQEQVVENIIAALKAIFKQMIRGWGNVRSIHLKTQSSPSLPLYENGIAPDDIDVKDVAEINFIADIRKRKTEEGIMKPKKHKRSRMSKSTLKKIKNEELQVPKNVVEADS